MALDRMRFLSVGLALALFGIVVGANLIVVDHCGSDLPEWDQWDAEGLHVYLPWIQHRLTVADIFLPHNEHRVVLTKLLGLAETAANGQWDARLQCVVNAALHAAIAIGLFLFGCRMLPGLWHAPLFILIAASFGLPLAWQNILGGFHSQQSFLLGLSALTVCLLPFARPLTGRWWAGVACALLAMLSMGSGFLAASVLIVVLGAAVMRRIISIREASPTLVLCLALTALGWFTRVTVSYHEPLKAHSFQEFFLCIAHNVRWPAPGSVWFATLYWLPWLAITWCLFTASLVKWKDAGVLFGLGGWTLLQIIASAYMRGAGGAEPASRYMDTLAFGVVVNGLALAWHCAHVPLPRRWSRVRGIIALAWMAAVGYGLHAAARHNLESDLPWVCGYHAEGDWRTRAYIATGERRYLDSKNIPYPGTDSLIERIDHPELRNLMPVSVRQPLPMAVVDSNGFTATDFRTVSISEPPPTTGLSPKTPPLVAALIWGSYGNANGHWESAPLPAPHTGWLRFEMAGDTGGPGTSLQLLDAATHQVLAEVRPTIVPHDSWRSAYVRAPTMPFIVTARVTNPGHWLAFGQPAEMATLSYWAWQISKQGVLILCVSAIAALGIGLASWLSPQRTA